MAYIQCLERSVALEGGEELQDGGGVQTAAGQVEGQEAAVVPQAFAQGDHVSTVQTAPRQTQASEAGVLLQTSANVSKRQY